MRKSKGYLKEKNGRYYARVAVPTDLRHLFGRSEILEPLGTDRALAEKQLVHEAVAMIRRKFDAARAVPSQPVVAPIPKARQLRPLSPEQIAILSYKDRLQQDTVFRQTSPAWASTGIDDQYVEWLRAGMAGRLENSQLIELVGNRIELFRALGNTDVEVGSAAWREVAIALCASEYEAMARVAERDDGEFSGKPDHPILKDLDEPEQAAPVVLMELWNEYVAKRQLEGSMQDGGRRQVLAIKSLISFTGKTNASDITKKDISDWQDDLLTKIAVRTIAKVYLPTIRSLFSWAVTKHKIATNPAEGARQAAPKLTRNREAGYTLAEALHLLNASRTYQPKKSPHGKVLENSKTTAAKRWVPLLCAFTGARVGELTQLRREDLRVEEDHWIIRITPEAGTVKAKQYRDIPMHPQLIELGFLDYVESIAVGPMFHMSPEPSRNRIHAQKMANRLRDWLHEEKLVPKNVQPCHGWRHRFKTVGIELGCAERVIDALQGHASRRSGDDYGDVTIKARIDAICRFPAFKLSETSPP